MTIDLNTYICYHILLDLVDSISNEIVYYIQAWVVVWLRNLCMSVKYLLLQHFGYLFYYF